MHQRTAAFNNKPLLAALFLCLQLVSSSVIRRPRLSLAPEWDSYHLREPQGPGTYAFGYNIDDAESNNVQFRDEERHPNGTVTGSYGYVDPEGKVRRVHYVADENGYRATVEDLGAYGRFKSRPLHSTLRVVDDQRTAGNQYNGRVGISSLDELLPSNVMHYVPNAAPESPLPSGGALRGPYFYPSDEEVYSNLIREQQGDDFQGIEPHRYQIYNRHA